MTGSINLELYNLLGQVVVNLKCVTINNERIINNLNLIKGVYLLKLSIANSSKTIKLINQ